MLESGVKVRAEALNHVRYGQNAIVIDAAAPEGSLPKSYVVEDEPKEVKRF